MNPSSASVPPFATRQSMLAGMLAKAGLQAFALNPGPSLYYLTGLPFGIMERPILAFFLPDQPLILVLPELELLKAANLSYPVRTFPYGEDPATWQSVFAQALDSTGLPLTKIGVEPEHMRVLELRLLEGSKKGLQAVSSDSLIAALRMHKDETEIENMRTAARIAQNALKATIPAIKVGVTEREIASELMLQLMRAGTDVSNPFSPIVSGGPNSANPHASPSDRPLKSGDLLVIDWGASHRGYYSDITRTFALGNVEPEYEKIGSIVLQANAAGRSACAPGVLAEAVDGAARKVIEQAGYGVHFTHRTGHGLGMEIHEAPYIRSGNRISLEPGMTFTVEPGIYLAGRGGVRIEDDVAITASGSESLTDMAREVQRLG